MLLYCIPRTSVNPFAKVKYKYVSFFPLENASIEEATSTICDSLHLLFLFLDPHAFAICYPTAEKKFVLAVPTGSEKHVIVNFNYFSTFLGMGLRSSKANFLQE